MAVLIDFEPQSSHLSLAADVSVPIETGAGSFIMQKVLHPTVTVRIKEEPVSPDILTDQPQPSAPPIDVLGHAEIKHVNSYSGLLGKRRSLFSLATPPSLYIQIND